MILFALIAVGFICYFLINKAYTQKEAEAQPTVYPIEHGISAPFAGFIGDNLLIGGGCNFPNKPAADGGEKIYYSNLFTLNIQNDSAQWVPTLEFPFPIAYGATVETPKGLVCIGGMNSSSSLKDVLLIHKCDSSDAYTYQYLPTLPEAIDNASATSVGNSLYITGGNQGNGGKSLYTLKLGVDSVWTRLADYPGNKRIQPVLLASKDKLFLFGGFDVKTIHHEATDQQFKEGIVSSDFLVYKIKENEWSQPQSIPTMKDGNKRALVGSSGVRINNLLIIAGGVNYSIFKSAIEGKAPTDYMKRPTDWYQFSKDVLIYDLQAQKWSIVSDVNGFNKAGGCLLHHKDNLYMVCGETKPGIRTNQIVKMSIKKLLPIQ